MPIGVYDHEPPVGAEGISSLYLPEAVPLLGLDSTRVLRQMSELTRLRDRLSSVLDEFIP